MSVYVDTSALVKLYLREKGSKKMMDRVQGKLVATSLSAYSEAHATFARQQREGGISQAKYRQIVEQFEQEWASLLLLPLSAAVLKSIRNSARLTLCEGLTLCT